MKIGFEKIVAVNISFLMFLGLFSGCGDASSKSNSAQIPSLEKKVSTDISGSIDPFGKYEPSIQIETINNNGSAVVKYPEGDTVENNAWTRAYEEELGIKLKYRWVDDSNEKLNLMISTGDLPDILMLKDYSQYQELYEAGLIEDLTDVFKNYASEFTKTIYSGEYIRELEAITRNGKIYAVPFFNDYKAVVQEIWIRKDWLDNLKLEVPKTADEFFTVASAFAKSDPDKNGQNDTYGITMNCTGIFNSTGISSAFWNIFHSYPDIWTYDTNKKLTYGVYGSTSQAENTKKALLKLQDLYKDGVLRKDFATIDQDQQGSDVINNKCGIFIGTASRPYFQLGENVKANPKAQWIPIMAPSVDAGDSTISVTPLNLYGLYAVKKGYEHPEALIKMLNMYSQKLTDPKTTTDETLKKFNSVFKATPFRLYYPYTSINDYNSLTAALNLKDSTSLTVAQRKSYDLMKDYIDNKDVSDGKWAEWVYYYGDNSAMGIAKSAFYNNKYVYDEYMGPPTQAFISKQPIINKQWVQVMTEIITGGNISKFDDFVKQYPSMGGTEIMDEVNKWQKENIKK